MALTVLSGQTHNVDFGNTESNDVVLSGGILEVSLTGASGTVVSTIAFSGADEFVFSNGITEFATMMSGGFEEILHGGQAVSTTLRGGVQDISGGTATGTIVSSGFMIDQDGGFAESSLLLGGAMFLGSASSAYYTKVDGGVLDVESSGFAFSTTVSSGYQVVASAGLSEDASVLGGDELVVGAAYFGTVGPNGTEVVEIGGVSVEETMNGVEINFGFSELDAINSGVTQVTWGSGAVAFDNAINSGAFAFVVTGGFAEENTVSGTEFVVQGGSSLLEFVHGIQVVSNAFTNESLIYDLGVQVVDGGGFAELSVIYAGGTMFVESGGSSYEAVISSGGNVFVYGGGAAISSFIETDGTLELASGGSTDGTPVFFAGSGGILRLDDSQQFTGSVSGLDASPGVGADTNYIDLKDIVYGGSTHFSWSSSGAGSGTLTVTDGTHTAHLELLGNYTMADFRIATDGAGGTYVFDPEPAAQSSGTTLASHPA